MLQHAILLSVPSISKDVLVLGDDLFPHVTGGLRGRVLTVASMDVSNKSIHLQYVQVFRLGVFYLEVIL